MATNDRDVPVGKGRPEMDITIESEVIDCDAHIREEVDDLIPYMDDGEVKDYATSPYFKYPADAWDRSAGGRAGYATVRGPEDQRQIMQDLSLDTAIITPTKQLYHGMIGNRELAAGLARAYNDYVVDVWLDESDVFKSFVFVPVQDPEAGAEEIDRLGDEDGMVGVFLNPVGPEKGLGDERYHPIYEAAERQDLTIGIHGAATTHSTYPLQTNYFHKFLEVHAISHPFQQMAQLTSIICRGVPELFDLRFVMMEAGLSWTPYLYRLDKEYLARTNEAPHLEKLPSEYFQEQFWTVCQPIEETSPNFEALVEMAGGWDRILFATDWPHWDFDVPTVVRDLAPREHWDEIYHGNAKNAFPSL